MKILAVVAVAAVIVRLGVWLAREIANAPERQDWP